jgi:hypothetical protein
MRFPSLVAVLFIIVVPSFSSSGPEKVKARHAKVQNAPFAATATKGAIFALLVGSGRE